MVNKTAMNISNASSEWVVAKVIPSNGKATEQMVKPGESKKFCTDYGQIKVQLHLIRPDHSWYGTKSTRIESHKAEYEQTLCSYNNLIIRNGMTGLELVQARDGTLWQ